MAQPITGIEKVAAWFDEYGVMATLISPTRAVALSSSIPNDHDLRLYPGTGSAELEPRVLIRDASRDLVLLEVSADDIPASFGSGVFTYANTPEVGDPWVVEAHVLTRDTIGLPPSDTAIVGAPVIADGKLFGMIRASGGEGSWRCVPASELTAWAEPAPYDKKVFFSRLTAGGLRALSYAAGAAVPDLVDMDHLYFGLHENYAGTARRLFRARNVTPKPFIAAPAVLTELPDVYADVQRAFEAAMHLADQRGEHDIRGRHILHGALTVKPFAGLAPQDVQLDDHRSVLGHRADTVDGEDLLDIKREARVLAGVLGASTVEPPISLGLFGEWGSGKSFFMREMERQFTELEGTPGYCHNIVQIWFNAWHYIDTPNLWASLAAEIFERLDFELDVREKDRPRDLSAQQRAAALAQSAKARSELATITAAREGIESEMQDVESKLATLEDEREIARTIGLTRVFTTAVDAAATDPQAKAKMKEIGERIDEARRKVPLSERSVAQLRETTDRGKAIVLAAKDMPLVSWLVIVLFALLIVVGATLATRLDDALRVLIGILGVLLSPLAAWTTKGGEAARALYKAWTLKERLIEEERAERAKPLVEKHDELKGKLAAAETDEKNKAKELQDSEETLAGLEPRRQMSNFVRERKKSTDYTRHLGVIASAHDDFAELSRLLRRATAENDDKKVVPPVDRIVLYIDDLDRCPEDKVVDVLQAVHLLLAFPLFIVVVGVDSRWLLHSLQRHLKQFSTVGVDDDAPTKTLWASTPLNYLEKIFQIPFTIRRMKPGAFGDLIENLTRPQDQVARERAALVRVTAPAPPSPETPKPRAGVETRQTGEQRETPGTPVSPSSQPAKAPEPRTVDFLTLNKWETDDMKALYRLIPSPRAAKRFVNTYRLMRGMVDEYERNAFIGNEKQPGGYRAALVMLAMLTGYPEETTKIMRELVTTEDPLDPNWWKFIKPQIHSDSLREDLAEIEIEFPPPPPTDIFKKWAPDVARFSFHSGRIVSAQV